MRRKNIVILTAVTMLMLAAGCQNPNGGMTPTDTPAPTATAAPAATSKPTAAPTATATPTLTNTPVPTATAVPTATNTPAPTATNTPTPTNTPVPTATKAPVPTAKPTPVLPEGVLAVEEVADNVVRVTLNTKSTNVNVKNFTVMKHLTDWNALSKKTLTFDSATGVVSQNAEGYTVITYSIPQTFRFSNLANEIKIADNYLSWQMDHGGWDKGVEDQAKTAWNGKDKKNKFSGWASKKGEPLGTIDNEGTYTQMRHIAAVYREVPEAKYQEAVLKGLDFIFLLQYESGGFAQVYPRRGNYSDNVTFNDNAMVNVLLMLTDMKNHAFPFDSDIIPEEYMVKIEASIEKAVDYILKSQIISKGKLTAWCAQHDPVTYAPVGARAYELASISGKESVAIVKFLLMQEQTPEVENAVKSAIQWFYDAEDKGVRYVENDPNGVYFVEDAKSSLWYRFYDIQTGSPIFCDRDGIKRYSIAEISEERRNGYSWCDTYPKKLLQFYEKNGLVFTHFEVKMSGN